MRSRHVAARKQGPRPAVALWLFWSSLTGCISTVVGFVAAILSTLTFDEREGGISAGTDTAMISMLVLRVSSFAALVSHILFSRASDAAAANKPNVPH
jgi:hypothetical protein